MSKRARTLTGSDTSVAPRIFQYYDTRFVETISYTYFVTELSKYVEEGSPWRPCINGLSDPDNPMAGCIGTRVIGGLNKPIREFAYFAEFEAGHVDIPVARQCVYCMIADVKSRMFPYNQSQLLLLPFQTIQPFKIVPSEWPVGSVEYPSNTRGFYNGLSAPFPQLDTRMLCSLDDSVKK